MAKKTISLDAAAYELLRSHKREGESFSDVIKRLAGGRSWKEVAGIWSESADDVEQAIEAGRERARARRDVLSAEFQDG